MKKMAPLLGVLALGAIGAGYYVYQKSGHATAEEHRKELDRGMEPLVAMMKAPDGATPCETAYNAHAAYEERAKSAAAPRPWGELPDRATFLQRCGTLAQQEQLCLQPRYQVKQHDLCDPLVEKVHKSNVLYQWMGPALGAKEPPPLSGTGSNQ